MRNKETEQSYRIINFQKLVWMSGDLSYTSGKEMFVQCTLPNSTVNKHKHNKSPDTW